MKAGRRHLLLAAGIACAAQSLAFGAHANAASTPEPSPQSAGPSTGATAPQPSPQPSAPVPPSPLEVVLSNERTFTTSANPMEEVPIRQRPLAGSRRIARTHVATEDGYPEVYLLSSSFTDAAGRVWVRLRIPGRPNGRIGWVPRSALGEFHVSHWLIDISLRRRSLRAYL